MIIFLAVVVILFIISNIKASKNPGQVPSIAGYKIMTVLTGSMRPDIQPGDLILSKAVNTDEMQEGDIITYRVSDDTLVTHRIIEILENNGKAAYKTKGDANNVDDQNMVSPQDIEGRLALRIPKGGYLLKFLQGPIGFVLLFLLPIVLLIKGEFKNLVSEIGKNKQSNI